MPEREKEVFKVGDIVFGRNSGLCSRVVRMRTLSQWSHCGIILGRNHGTIKVISARWQGVTVDTLRDWDKNVQVLRLVEEVADPAQIDKMVAFAIRQVGKGYNWAGMINFFTLGGAQGKDHRWFCSELVHSAMQHAGIDLWKYKKPPKFITCGHLYENPNLKFVSSLGD